MEYRTALGTDAVVTAGVLDWFRLMSSVPHGSWNEGALATKLEEAFHARGWPVERDQWNNLKVEIPATPGFEQVPPVIVQGHLDMVCAVAADSGYNPQQDPITLVVEDHVLRTDRRSSLGADNNLGNAAALFLMEKPLKRGPIRLLLTVAEEVGLQGAKQVSPDWLQGCKFLINTDGFIFGTAVVSSAGGRRETYTRPLHTVPRKGSIAFEIVLSGFLGGHSGYDIARGRANAIKLLTLFLGELRESVEYDLAAFQGGHAHNAIPLGASAVITADRVFAVPLALAIERLRTSMGHLFGHSDPGYRIQLREVPPPERVWSTQNRDAALDLITLLYNGVFAMRDDMPDQVSASCNVGRVLVNEQNEVEINAFLRCAIDFSEEILAFQHARAAKLTGFRAAVDSYPGWMGDRKNTLAALMDRVLYRQTGQHMDITAVHVGLEPSVLGAKAPGLIMVSTGPDILNPHSTEEHAPLQNLPNYVRLLAGTLEGIAKGV